MSQRMRSQQRTQRRTGRQGVSIYRQAPVHQFLTNDYLESISNKLSDKMNSVRRRFEEELEHLRVLPEDREPLDEENLREIAGRVEEAEYQLMAARSNRFSTPANIQEAQEELDEVTLEYNTLRDQQKLQDAILDDPDVSTGFRGNAIFIDVNMFNPVSLGLSVDDHPYDLRFIGRLTNRLKNDEEEEGVLQIKIGPGFHDNGLQRLFPTISSAQLRILDDNLFGLVLSALRDAENEAYAEAEAGSRRRFIPGPPPLVRRTARNVFNSPFRNAGPINMSHAASAGNVARTLSYALEGSAGTGAGAAAPVRSIFAAMGRANLNSGSNSESKAPENY